MKPDFTENLLQWNKLKNRRSMPWKGEADPYRIWLSEVILQQTRVEQGLHYYQRFVDLFPTIQHLANASEEVVFKCWEGLGYYARCKNLIQTARKICNEFGGVFPARYEDLVTLPGIGAYTAAAIASFAFNLPYAVVDGNVQRVLSRYFGINTSTASAAGKKLYAQLAQELLDKDQPAAYNQAIMDFGSIVCKPKNPLCLQCVQRGECEAYRHGNVERLPVREKKPAKKKRYLHYFVINVNQHIYIRKRTTPDIWQNLHEFVLWESTAAEGFDEHIFLTELFGNGDFRITDISPVYRQQLTHQLVSGRFIYVSTPNAPRNIQGYSLIPASKLRDYAFPRFIARVLDK